MRILFKQSAIMNSAPLECFMSVPTRANQYGQTALVIPVTIQKYTKRNEIRETFICFFFHFFFNILAKYSFHIFCDCSMHLLKVAPYR